MQTGAHECSIRKHDAHTFEIKMAYPLKESGPSASFRVEAFLFFPYQLAVNEMRYPREHFYEDLHSYTRFKTPTLTLPQLLRRDEPTSPLTRIRACIADGRSGGRWDERAFLYETKTLANIIRVRVRDASRRLRARMRRSEQEASLASIAAEAGKLIQELQAVLADMRPIREELAASSAPGRLRRAFDWADEFASIETSEYLLLLLSALEKHDTHRVALETCRLLAECIRAESEYRRLRGWPSVTFADGKRNEKLLYRDNLLKKFCARVLFLSVEQKAGDLRARQFMYGLAAGVAMAFAALAAWLASRHWPEQSGAFVIALIIAYIFKDRIKEFIRDYGSRIIPRWVCDRTGVLRDPQYDNLIGRTRETMRWRHSDGIAAEVRRARPWLDSLEVAVLQGTEHVIHYTKDVRIDTDLVYRSHQRAIAINEIFRISTDRWLERMDDPAKTVLHLIDGGQAVSEVPSPRVYRVDMVVRVTPRLNGRPGESFFRAAKIILSHDGIVRIVRKDGRRPRG